VTYCRVKCNRVPFITKLSKSWQSFLIHNTDSLKISYKKANVLLTFSSSQNASRNKATKQQPPATESKQQLRHCFFDFVAGVDRALHDGMALARASVAYRSNTCYTTNWSPVFYLKTSSLLIDPARQISDPVKKPVFRTISFAEKDILFASNVT